MSNKYCEICRERFLDKDQVVVQMITKYNDIPSTVAYSMERPVLCLGMAHLGCVFPDGEYSDLYEGEDNGIYD